jgi:GNAT superfamily N-acetyltransferase
VPGLIIPTRHQVRAVLRESHTLWGAGLPLDAYIAMWEELADCAWGRAWYGWRAWVAEDGRVLSSLKLYRPHLRLGGSAARARAIGAVFTPREHRGRGYAASLIRAVLDEPPEPARDPGFLFTDIGVEYYAALGFAALPCEDALGTLRAPATRPTHGLTLRTMTIDDLDEVGRAHDMLCETRAIAILRDRAHWEFLLLRAASFFRRMDGSGLERRFMIASNGSRPVGYLVAVLGPGEWNVREAAAYDGDPATLARILAAGGEDAFAAGVRTVWGWIPRSWWPLVPAWRLRLQPRQRAIPMIRAPKDLELPAALDTAEGAYISYLDQF